MKLPHFEKLFVKLIISLFIVVASISYYEFYLKYHTYYSTTVRIEVSSGSPDIYQLFYDNGKYGYHHDLSITSRYDGLDNQVISFKIPGTRVKKFRIDPGQKKGIIEIKQISIHHGNIVKSWKDFELERDFRKLNDINKFKVDNGQLVIESKGIDPYFEYNGNLSI